MNFLPGQYAASQGWVADMDTILQVGTIFEWMRHHWEVMAHYPFPCCGKKVTVVRRENSSMTRWVGIGPCPNGCKDWTYQLKIDEETNID